MNKGKDKPILGYYPYLSSVGVKISANPYMDEEGKKSIKVGSTLQLPMDVVSEYYTYQDSDTDGDFTGELEVRWFILDDADWGTVTNWTDIETKTEIKTNTTQTNKVAELIVPMEAAGKRIGVTIVPKSETGVPRVGNRVYVWDLSSIFKQTDPKDPGGEGPGAPSCENPELVDPLDPEAGKPECNVGEPESPNPEITDPEVKFPTDFDVIFKDKNGNPIDNFTVDDEFIAEVTLGGQPIDQQLVENGTLTWVLYQPTFTGLDANGNEMFAQCDYNDIAKRQDESCFVQETYTVESPVIASNGLKRVENIFENGKLTQSLFRTQGINSDATTELQGINPNRSEQGYWIEVRFNTEKE